MGLFGSDRPNVSKLARRGKIDALREALRYEEVVVDDGGREWDLGAQTRVQAATALSTYEATAVAGNLVVALHDRAPAVRLAAVEAIGRLNAQVAGVAEHLVECVVSRRSDDTEVPARAVDVLVAWRSEGAAELVAGRLLDEDAPELDERHHEALERLLEVDVRGAAAREAIAQRVLAQLRQGSGDRGEANAEGILGWLGETALDPVLEALENGIAAPGVVRAAGMLGDARAVTPVVRGLESPDPRMREAAAVAARNLNHTRAVPALLTATQDDDQAVRDAASDALDRMGTAAVIAGLVAVVSARGLFAGNAGLEGGAEDELDGADAAQALQEAQVQPDEEPVPGPAPAAPAPAPAPPPDPWAYPGRGGRRRGGFIDRLLGGP